MDIKSINIGEKLSSKDSIKVTQSMINQFADCTGDHQWIHTQPDKCSEHSPYKTTIAHGFLSLSLMPKLFSSVLEFDEKTTTLINYGMDSLRFIEAVRVNDEVSYSCKLIEKEQKSSGVLYKFEGSVTIVGRDKPALIGVFLTLVL